MKKTEKMKANMMELAEAEILVRNKKKEIVNRKISGSYEVDLGKERPIRWRVRQKS